MKLIFTKNNRILKIILKHGDLTTQTTEVIVNAANNELWLGSGVAGAIRKKGGSKIQEECNKIISLKGGFIKNGGVELTIIGNFKNENLKYIFHAVGPPYRDGTFHEKEDLKNCFDNSFNLANYHKITSISFPPISTGIFRYPKEKAAEVFLESCKDYLEKFFQEKIIIKEKKYEDINKNFESPQTQINDELSFKIESRFENLNNPINYEGEINNNMDILPLEEIKLNENINENICDDKINIYNDINCENDKFNNDEEVFEFKNEYSLSEIYLVIIDDETFKPFEQVFKNKYNEWKDYYKMIKIEKL